MASRAAMVFPVWRDLVSISRLFYTLGVSFSVKSPQADALLAEVRTLTGEGITEAIIHSLQGRLAQLHSQENIDRIDWRRHVEDIQATYRHLAHHPGTPTDEFAMYDDDGVPV